MTRNRLIYPVLLCLCSVQSACTTTATTPDSSAFNELPSLSMIQPDYDQYLARIPAPRTVNPTVVRAMMHVALGKARLQAGRLDCVGIGMPDQDTDTLGPLRMVEQGPHGEQTCWYYRISQRVDRTRCSSEERARQLRAIQDKLPDWVTLIPANPDAATAGLASLPAQDAVLQPGTAAGQ